MVILGLGTNLGDRMANLRHALKLLKQVPQFSILQVSPVYISDALLPENAPDDWDVPYLNLAVRCETTLAPHDLLRHVKRIEREVGRVPNAVWGPRIMDIDLLAWDDRILYDDVLHIPHEHLSERPFALWPLADLAPFWVNPLTGKIALETASIWGSRFTGNAPFHTRQIMQRIDTPQLVGIINATPDSFSSEGGIAHAQSLVETGAEVVDIGGEATNPNAVGISAAEEWGRLMPVLESVLAQASRMVIPPKISVDTRHVDVAEKALAMGVDWINDVSGLDDPRMRELIASQRCDVVVMHHLGIPVDRNRILPIDKNPVDQVFVWAEQRLNELVQAGIAHERIIFDVGIGFGKNAQQCLELIKHIDRFKQLGTRLLVGHSRKIFLGQFTEKPFAERDIETLMLSLFLADHGVDYLRVHNVEAHARGFKVSRCSPPLKKGD